MSEFQELFEANASACFVRRLLIATREHMTDDEPTRRRMLDAETVLDALANWIRQQMVGPLSTFKLPPARDDNSGPAGTGGG